MNNCKRNGGTRAQGCGNGEGRGRAEGVGRNCQGFGQGRGRGERQGKKRALFEEKYNVYLKTASIPEFETDEKYQEWISSTPEGQIHIANLDRINEEVDAEFPWGGRRENSGRRKECVRKIPYTRRISADVLDILKSYAREHNITETEALEKAILKLKE